jgi:hypothetical protein
VLDAQLARDRIDLKPGRRRCDGDGVAATLVRADEVAGLGPDGPAQLLAEQALPQLLEFLEAAPAQGFDCDRPKAPRISPEQRTVGHDRERPRELARPDLSPSETLPVERAGGVAGHERPVEVEQGSDRRPARAALDLGHELGDPGHPAASSVVGVVRNSPRNASSGVRNPPMTA